MINFIVKGKIIQVWELTHTDTSLLTDNNEENNEFWTSILLKRLFELFWNCKKEKLTMSEIDIFRNAYA